MVNDPGMRRAFSMKNNTAAGRSIGIASMYLDIEVSITAFFAAA